jgi:hypothetical protein
MKKILLAVLALALIGGGIAYYQFNKPRETAAEKKADVVLSVDSLFSSFQSDETLANKTYLNKVIQIEGVLTSSEMANGHTTCTLTSATDGVVATFMLTDSIPASEMAQLVGKKVQLKGFFAGFNYDSMMPEMGGTFEFNESALIK